MESAKLTALNYSFDKRLFFLFWSKVRNEKRDEKIDVL